MTQPDTVIDDKDEVVELLKITRSELKFVTYGVFPKLLRGGKRYLQGARDLWTKTYPRFEMVMDKLTKVEIGDLERAGLAGIELQTKSSWIRRLVRRLHRDTGWRFPFSKRRVTKILKGLFVALNSFLGSLASLIPGVEPIKEFKEYLESGLEVL